MNEITFTRKSERTLTHVEPSYGYTLQEVVNALNDGRAAVYSHEGVGRVVIAGDLTIAIFQECQSTAAGDVDEGFKASH